MSDSRRFVMMTAFVGLCTGGLAACGAEDDPMAPTAAEGTPAAGMSPTGTPSAGMPPASTPAEGVNCPAKSPLAAPSMPAGIAPPSGAQLTLRTYAVGTQKYTCQMGAAGPAWTFKAPEAKLYDDNCVLVGTHFGGPTWQLTNDGSAVVGKKMSEAPSPVAQSIPWLLLSATPSAPGGLGGTAFINRIDTIGGIAPDGGCAAANIGEEAAVPYTAVYLYYRAAGAAASGGYGYP